MNTKKKTIAIMLAAIMVSAVAVPMAMAIDIGTIDITVPNEPPEIKCKCECPDENHDLPGTQILPNMDGTSKTVTICAVVCDRNGKGDITSVTADVFYPSDPTRAPKTVTLTDTCDGTCCLDAGAPKDCRMPVIAADPAPCEMPQADDPTCKLYCGPIVMDACDPSGEYRVVVTATDSAGGVDNMQNRFFYESNVLIELDFTTINFGDIEICVPSCVYGDVDMNTPAAPTIHNYGNDPVVIVLHSLGLKKGGAGEPVDTIKLDATIPGDGEPCDGTDLPTCVQITFDKVLDPCCGTVAVDFSIHVEEGTAPGTYSGGIEIEAKHAPTREVLLENKDSSDDHLYDPITGDGKYGDLTYNLEGSSDCGYTFEGYGLTTDTEYCLIYFPEPWPGTGGMLLGRGTADASGEVTISGSNMPCGLPTAGDNDWDYDLAGGKYAKFWLVECADYNDGVGPMTGWHPEAIFFDMETIATCPC